MLKKLIKYDTKHSISTDSTLPLVLSLFSECGKIYQERNALAVQALN
jgi:hypothetical protein